MQTIGLGNVSSAEAGNCLPAAHSRARATCTLVTHIHMNNNNKRGGILNLLQQASSGCCSFIALSWYWADFQRFVIKASGTKVAKMCSQKEYLVKYFCERMVIVSALW